MATCWRWLLDREDSPWTCYIVPPDLQGHDSQQVYGPRMLGLHREDLPIDPFRLREESSPMLRDGMLKGVRDSHCCHVANMRKGRLSRNREGKAGAPLYYTNCAKILFASSSVSLLPTSNQVPGTFHVCTGARW